MEGNCKDRFVEITIFQEKRHLPGRILCSKEHRFINAQITLTIILIIVLHMTVPPQATTKVYALADPPGSLDTSFDIDGKTTTDFGGDDTANDVAIQSDGKIVVAGYVVNGS